MSNCETCGQVVPEPEVAVEEAVDLEPVAEASVEVARIEADRDIKVAKIAAHVADDELELRLAALEGELRGIKEAMVQPEPEVAPEPVIVAQDVAPEPEPEMPPREEREEPKAPRKPKGFFG